jgi:hypothetical protein
VGILKTKEIVKMATKSAAQLKAAIAAEQQPQTEENKPTAAPETATAPRFKRVASVSRPVLKLVLNKTYFILIQSAFKSEKLSEEQRKKSAYPESEVITIFDVVDLESGEEMQCVGRSVFVSEISEKYPNDSYVGKAFEFSLSKPEGKRYTVPRIYEIEV